MGNGLRLSKPAAATANIGPFEITMGSLYAIVSDIDGVLHRGSKVIPGARKFVSDLRKSGRNYLFLTNSPDRNPTELQVQLRGMGMDVPRDKFYTAGQAIAEFLTREQKHPLVRVFGSKSLREEIKRKGARITEGQADFVVVTATETFAQKQINQAIEMIQQGAKFITANDDHLALTATGMHAGTGALVTPIVRATGCRPYVVGKPNHLMIRGAEEKFGIDPRRAWMIGDNLDSDINVGMQAQMKTILVLSGVTGRSALIKSPYQPTCIRQSVAQIKLNKLS